jgi:hypothetical protein
MFFDSKNTEGSLSCSQKPSIGLHPEQFIRKSVLVLQRIPIDTRQRLKLKLFVLFCCSSEGSHCRIFGVTACGNKGRYKRLR